MFVNTLTTLILYKVKNISRSKNLSRIIIIFVKYEKNFFILIIDNLGIRIILNYFSEKLKNSMYSILRGLKIIMNLMKQKFDEFPTRRLFD